VHRRPHELYGVVCSPTPYLIGLPSIESIPEEYANEVGRTTFVGTERPPPRALALSGVSPIILPLGCPNSLSGWVRHCILWSVRIVLTW
jgi:hypothetical protein